MIQIIPGLWDIDEIGSAVHAYLWEWEGGVTLIDCGMPAHADKILDALVANRYPVHAVNRIIITHVDLDHTGGLPAVQARTGAAVICHEAELQYMENPGRRRPRSLLLTAPLALSRLLPGMRQRPTSPQYLVVDGQLLPEGFTVVHTPGHTPGHISLLHREARLLVAGDALMNRRERLKGPPSAFTPDPRAAQRSIWRLAKQYGDDYETVVFGHGPPILANGGKRVRALASQIFSEQI
ncbi:MAG: MBL fold metallo-hydrolase [Caldilineaceae bacterium]